MNAGVSNGLGRRSTATAPPRPSGACLKTVNSSRRTGGRDFIFAAPRPLAEPVDREFPFALLTGRGTSAQWHTGSRTDKSNVLRALSPAGCYVEVNPKDAARLGLAPNAPVQIRSRRASLVAVAIVTPTVQPGQVFIPMHYAEVNQLTHPSFDPHSRQPNYKHCAVALEKPDGKIRRHGVTK